MLCIPEQTIAEVKEVGFDLFKPKQLQDYAAKALSDMKTGAAFAKSYSEFRNGFRHPFATSMAIPASQPELMDSARNIDICLSIITADDLEDILTFDPNYEEYIERSGVVN